MNHAAPKLPTQEATANTGACGQGREGHVAPLRARLIHKGSRAQLWV
jgi:hypothetical protein